MRSLSTIDSRRWVGFAAALGALLGEGTARAQDAAQNPPGALPPNWSLAAGIGFIGPSSGAAPAGSGSGPNASVLFERRVSRSLWLLARADGGYSTSRSESDGASGSTGIGIAGANGFDSKSASGGGALGVRYVFTPDRPFQVSTFATVGALYAKQTGSTTAGGPQGGGSADVELDGDGVDIGGRLGVALDRELLDGLGLRLACTFGYGGWSTRTQRITAAGQESTLETSGWSGGVTLSPAIEVRFSF